MMRLFHVNIPDSIRKGTWKQKTEYIWEYYKVHIIVICFFAFLIFSYLYSVITEKQILLNGIFLNTVTYDAVEELKEEYIKENSINTKKYDIAFEAGWNYSLEAVGESALNNSHTSQIIAVRTVAGDLDFVIGNSSVMESFSYGEYFCDLREVLSEEEIERFYPYFLYVDNMAETVPVLINISDSEEIKKIYPGAKESIAVGIVAGSQNKENIIKLLNLLEN